jgi:DUF1680 family protein
MKAFTFDYDLPNETAYAETCAAVALVFWSHRLLQLDCDRRYADVMERALYNGVISGISLDGKSLLLRKSAGQPGRASPPALVRLRLLPAQRRPAAGFAGRVYLRRQRR